MVKRVMTPAINGMTVKEERACLSEIRHLSPNISYKDILFNGWTAGQFALKYVTGHYRKRKIKEKNSESILDIRCDDDYSDMEDDHKFLCDPFAPRPQTIKEALLKQTKRTQRYRSTAKSRILGMTVGDIRYCFQQLRNAGKCLTPELVLYNGQCAGEFALCYLIETSNSMRNRRRKSAQPDTVEMDEESVDPESQINVDVKTSIDYSKAMTFS